ncbi:MAG: prepilin-type N-terminal cleavage/methylation domain-containing protein [bacterium]
MNKGFTLLEVIIVAGMVSALIAIVSFMYVLGLESWGAGKTRIELRESLNQGIQTMVRDIRHAKDPTTVTDSVITITAVDFESGVTPPPDATYRYYLYNSGDALPNPPYTASSYMLMQSKNTAVYGAGRVLARDVAQPASAPFAESGNLVTISLSVAREGQTISIRTAVNRRN